MPGGERAPVALEALGQLIAGGAACPPASPGEELGAPASQAGAEAFPWTAHANSLSGTVTMQIPDLDTFSTEIDFPGLAVTGTVSTKDGRPAAGARVRELTSGDLVLAADDGSFALGGLQPGPAVLQASIASRGFWQSLAGKRRARRDLRRSRQPGATRVTPLLGRRARPGEGAAPRRVAPAPSLSSCKLGFA